MNKIAVLLATKAIELQSTISSRVYEFCSSCHLCIPTLGRKLGVFVILMLLFRKVLNPSTCLVEGAAFQAIPKLSEMFGKYSLFLSCMIFGGSSICSGL